MAYVIFDTAGSSVFTGEYGSQPVVINSDYVVSVSRDMYDFIYRVSLVKESHLVVSTLPNLLKEFAKAKNLTSKSYIVSAYPGDIPEIDEALEKFTPAARKNAEKNLEKFRNSAKAWRSRFEQA